MAARFRKHDTANALVPDDSAAREMLDSLQPGWRVSLTEADRSEKSHRSEFAFVHRTFKNLPEGERRFRNPEHLRKWCLIKRGWCNYRAIAAASEDDAGRLAIMVGEFDPYAVVKLEGDVVQVWVAVSQSMKAMGKPDWEKSKQDVLEECAALIGVEPEELMRAA